MLYFNSEYYSTTYYSLIVVKSHIISLSLEFGKYFNNFTNIGLTVFFEIV